MSNGQTRVGDIHDSVIESIAVQYQINEDEVREIYESELSRLQTESRIKSFLPVLCTRHVKEILLHTGKFRVA